MFGVRTPASDASADDGTTGETGALQVALDGVAGAAIGLDESAMLYAAGECLDAKGTTAGVEIECRGAEQVGSFEHREERFAEPGRGWSGGATGLAKLDASGAAADHA